MPIINARAIQVEQELKSLYDTMQKHSVRIKDCWNESEEGFEELLEKIRVTRHMITICREDLRLMLEEAKPDAVVQPIATFDLFLPDARVREQVQMYYLGQDTHWMDIDFGAYLCSSECEHAKWAEYREAEARPSNPVKVHGEKGDVP